jgi:hypothetical protein
MSNLYLIGCPAWQSIVNAAAFPLLIYANHTAVGHRFSAQLFKNYLLFFIIIGK